MCSEGQASDVTYACRKRLALNLQFCTLEERSSATQMKAWGSYRGAIGHEGRKVEARSKGEALDELALPEWDFPEHLLTETPLLSPKDIRSACDDLLPALSSLIEMSEVSGSTAYLAGVTVDSADSADFPFLGAATPLGQLEGCPDLHSSELQAAASSLAALAAPDLSSFAVDIYSLESGTVSPIISVQKPEHDIGLPKEGLSEHHMSVDMELLAPASPLGMPSPFASGTPGVRSQLEAAAMDICIFGESQQGAELPFAAERMGSTASNDSTTVSLALTAALAGLNPLPAASAATAGPATCGDRAVRARNAPSTPPCSLGPAGGRVARTECAPPPQAHGRAGLGQQPACAPAAPAAAAAPATAELTAAQAVTAAHMALQPCPKAAPVPTSTPTGLSPPAARRMPTTARNRQLQREYLQRKRVRPLLYPWPSQGCSERQLPCQQWSSSFVTRCADLHSLSLPSSPLKLQ